MAYIYLKTHSTSLKYDIYLQTRYSSTHVYYFHFFPIPYFNFIFDFLFVCLFARGDCMYIYLLKLFPPSLPVW